MFGADHPRPLATEARRGRILVDLGRFAEAVAPLERAIAGLSPETTNPALLGETRFALARALVGLPRPSRARVRRVASEAAASFGAAGPDYAAQLADVNVWLDRLPP